MQQIMWTLPGPVLVRQVEELFERKQRERHVVTSRGRDCSSRELGKFSSSESQEDTVIQFLPEQVINIDSPEKQITSTLGTGVCCKHSCNASALSPCSHEEADTRFMVHLADASCHYERILIKTVDTEVMPGVGLMVRVVGLGS